MPAIERPSRLIRILQTPLTSLFTRRIAQRISVEELVDASGLDEPVQALIKSLCERTRLWHNERAEVAHELIGHFRDGIDAGATSDALVSDFGDPMQAARLIRRAKIRNRPLAWHALRWLRRGIVLLLLVYVALAIRFFNGSPSITTDYIAQLNTDSTKLRDAERAWPFYLQFSKLAEKDNALGSGTPRLDLNTPPGSKRWTKVAAWVDAHPEILALIDQATARPQLGFVYGPEGSVSDIGIQPMYAQDPSHPLYRSLISVLLPYLNDSRHMASVLVADARVAAERGDAQRWLKRIDQIGVVANHARDLRIVVNCLVGIGVESLRLVEVERLLQERPDLLTDSQWTDVAHTLATYQRKTDLMSFEGERMMFADVVQRIYTDDGEGSGRLAAQGLGTLNAMLGSNNRDLLLNLSPSAPVRAAVWPAASLVLASRQELVEKYDELMRINEAALNRPYRAAPSVSVDSEVRNLMQSTLGSTKFLVLLNLMPSLERASLTAERLIVRRDAIQTGIALELFRRRNGNYPATLAELTPRLLPDLPIDPCDGKPLRYRLQEGRPLLYSVGSDLDDDGGSLPFTIDGSEKPSDGGELAVGNHDRRFDGDWILFPQARDSEVADEETSATQPSATE